MLFVEEGKIEQLLLPLFVLFGLLLKDTIGLSIYEIFHFFCSLLNFPQILGPFCYCLLDGCELSFLGGDIAIDLFDILSQLLNVNLSLADLSLNYFQIVK